MPADSKKLGIDFKSLKNPTTSQGIGGLARGFDETVVLSFSDRRYIYSYLLKIEEPQLLDRGARRFKQASDELSSLPP
jgi:hypothetical protein